MESNLRSAGREGLGDMASGSHFCMFYETEQGLLEMLSLYFRLGLENNEFCLWITPDPSIETARNTLRQVLPSADQHLETGRIEILSSQQWYCENDEFDDARAIQAFDAKLSQALEKGYTRMRVLADQAWLHKEHWQAFSDYERQLDKRFANKPVSIVCAYPTVAHNAADILDVARTHHLIAAKRNGNWEILESPELERAKNEYRLQAAIDAADIVLWERNLSSGHITWLGQHEKLLGFAPGELDDNTLADFEKRVHPEDIENLRTVRQRALEERAGYTHEYRVIWRDGSIHWIRAQGRFIYNEAGQPMRLYGAVLDITERKQAEEALRKSERVLREAEFLGHTGSWEQDLGTGEIFNTEENLCLFFGDDHSKEMPLDDYAQAVHPDDREFVLRRREQLVVEGGPGDIEFRVVWPDGSVHVLFGRATVVRDESGKAIRVYGTNLDITERKRAEEEIRQHAARMEVLAEIAQALAEVGLDVQAVFDTIARYTAERIGDSCGIRLLSNDEQWLNLVAFHHPIPATAALLKPVYLTPMPADQEWFRQVLRTGQSLVLPAVTREQFESLLPVGFQRVAERYRLHSALLVPLRVEGRVIGTISLTRVDPAGLPYTPNDQVLLQELADRAGLTLQNARLFQTVSEHDARMQVLAEISRTLEEIGLDYRSVLNTVARSIADLIGDACVITRFSDDGQRSFPVAFHHPDPKALVLMREALLHTWQGGTDTQRYQALLSGASIYIPEVSPEDFRATLEPEFRDFFDAFGVSSVLIVPLQLRGRVIGTLGLTRDRHGSPYTPDDQLLLQNLADRAGLIIQNAQLYEQVEAARARLEALSRRLLEVQESERRSLTRELHDRVGQNLTGLSINLQNMKALLSGNAALALAAKFDDAQGLVQDITRQIRDIMAELHLPELEDYGLAPALETYAERAASRGNLELITDLQVLPDPPLPSEVRIALFRAAQEAISNVLKHANATQLEVSLVGQDGRIHLKIEDNGQGFVADLASQKEAPTWGLQIMRERIESIDGRVQIESKPRQGTRVTFEIERPQ